MCNELLVYFYLPNKKITTIKKYEQGNLYHSSKLDACFHQMIYYYWQNNTKNFDRLFEKQMCNQS